MPRKYRKRCLHCRKPRSRWCRVFCSVACRRAHDLTRRKPCKHCGKPIERDNPDYCNRACYDAARAPSCPTCGGLRRRGRRYCSKACRPLVKRETCVNCGGDTRRNSKYCGKKCQQELRAARPLATRTCTICAQPFQSVLNKYCSAACGRKARTKIHKCKSCGDSFTTLRSDNYEGRTYCKPCWQNRGSEKPYHLPYRTNPPGGWMREVNLELLAKYAYRRGARRAARKFNLTTGQVSGWWHRHGKALVSSKRLC